MAIHQGGTRTSRIGSGERRKRCLASLGERIPGIAQADLTIEIAWANDKHADAESVFGLIADALFVNDKHVAGSLLRPCGGQEAEGRSDD